MAPCFFLCSCASDVAALSFLKEETEISLPEEELKKLMYAIPGGPGAEWVDENWLTYSKIPLDKIQIRRYAFYKLLKVI